MPAPGTMETIPGVIKTVAGFLYFIAKPSPNIPTQNEAIKVAEIGPPKLLEKK